MMIYISDIIIKTYLSFYLNSSTAFILPLINDCTRSIHFKDTQNTYDLRHRCEIRLHRINRRILQLKFF